MYGTFGSTAWISFPVLGENLKSIFDAMSVSYLAISSDKTVDSIYAFGNT